MGFFALCLYVIVFIVYFYYVINMLYKRPSQAWNIKYKRNFGNAVTERERAAQQMSTLLKRASGDMKAFKTQGNAEGGSTSTGLPSL